MDPRQHSRRQFLSTALAGTASTALAESVFARAQSDAAASGSAPQGVPHRSFGRHDEQVSLLCVGGHHIGRPDEAEAIRIIRYAIDNGATFLDNAWDYHHGESEKRMGKALQEGYRDKAFLMTKHHGRDKTTAMKHLDDSLRRLKTDHIDLWQYHEIVYDDDPKMIFSSGGGIEAAELAKKQGKVRYIGFTGHKHPILHLQMLAYEYPWDAVQMPLNPFDANYASFEKWVLPVLIKRGIAPLAMKTRGGGELLKTDKITAEECWRYAAALPVATIVSGMESMDLLKKNLRLARNESPMTNDQMKSIRQRVASASEGGTHELYKTSRRFDGWAGRKLHNIPM